MSCSISSREPRPACASTLWSLGESASAQQHALERRHLGAFLVGVELAGDHVGEADRLGRRRVALLALGGAGGARVEVVPLPRPALPRLRLRPLPRRPGPLRRRSARAAGGGGGTSSATASGAAIAPAGRGLIGRALVPRRGPRPARRPPWACGGGACAVRLRLRRAATVVSTAGTSEAASAGSAAASSGSMGLMVGFRKGRRWCRPRRAPLRRRRARKWEVRKARGWPRRQPRPRLRARSSASAGRSSIGSTGWSSPAAWPSASISAPCCAGVSINGNWSSEARPRSVEELARRRKERGAADGFAMADHLDPVAVFELLQDQRVDRDAPDVLHVAPRDRLPVGDDRQRLEDRAGVARAASRGAAGRGGRAGRAGSGNASRCPRSRAPGRAATSLPAVQATAT